MPRGREARKELTGVNVGGKVSIVGPKVGSLVGK